MGVVSNIIAATCVWTEWSDGKCSAACGGGTRTRTRTKRVEEYSGGTCTGSSTMQEKCNTNDCFYGKF